MPPLIPMNSFAAGCEQAFGDRIERGLWILLVDANAAFDSNSPLTTPFMVATQSETSAGSWCPRRQYLQQGARDEAQAAWRGAPRLLLITDPDGPERADSQLSGLPWDIAPQAIRTGSAVARISKDYSADETNCAVARRDRRFRRLRLATIHFDAR